MLLQQFRAGKMHFDGKTVVADARRGLIRVLKGEEGLVHFQWLDLNDAAVEDDQIVFPDEAVFEKVTESPGRVYVLKFSADTRRFFFWMQEVNADGDRQLCESVNYHINQQQPLETGVVDDAPPPSDSGVAAAGAVQLEDLQRILSNIGGEQNPDEDGVGLGDILRFDLIEPLIGVLPLRDRLLAYLPDDEGRENVDTEIVHLLQSPPFRQQVDSFTHVLRTGQIDLSQFGISPAKFRCTVVSFLEALEELVSREQDDREAMDEG